MIAHNSLVASVFFPAATNCSASFNCKRTRSDPLGVASISSRNDVRLSGEALLPFVSAACVSGSASAGLSPDLSAGSLTLLSTGLPGSSPVFAAAGLIEFSLGDLTTLETGGCSEGGGACSPDLALTLRARNLPAAGVEFETCLGFFLIDLF